MKTIILPFSLTVIIFIYISIFFQTEAWSASEKDSRVFGAVTNDSKNFKNSGEFTGSRLLFDKKKLKARRNQLLSKITHKRLERVHKLLSQDRPAKALLILNRLRVSKKRPYEQARVLYIMGLAHTHSEKYGESIRFFRKALELEVLDYLTTLSVLYNLAQVNTAVEKYDEALRLLDQWFKLADSPEPEAYVLKAGILAQKKKTRQALLFVNKAIESVQTPKESWLVLAVAMNYQLEKFREARILLEKLTALYPEKKKYWNQLSSVYINLEKDPKALATMELAEKADYLTEKSEIMNLVSLLIYGGIPLKGAKILAEALKEGLVEKNQKNYEILGDAWNQAEELDKALKAYARSATLAKDGRIFAKQGRIYLDQENWEKASHYLSKALKKGRVKNPQNVYMALGVSQFNLGQVNLAKKSFDNAKKKSSKLSKTIKKRITRQADQWIAYMMSEETGRGNLSLRALSSKEETSASLVKSKTQ